MVKEGGRISRTQKLALIALFSALAVVLRLTIEVPFPPATYLRLEVWEIPVYIALLAYRLKLGLAVASVMYVIVQVFATGFLPTGPIYNLMAVLSTVGGVSLVLRLRRSERPVTSSLGTALAAIVSGAFSRLLIMTGVNALVLPQPPPIGFALPAEAVPLALFWTGVFNVLVAAYSVGISFPIARRIGVLLPS